MLVIFIDTLRFDRLGIAGYRRDGKSLTPRLDELAAQSVMFTHAYAQSPNTPRSVPSFLTSRYSSQVKVDKKFKDYATVLDDNDTLFEALQAGGFTTIGETSHFYFCDRKRYPETCPDVVSWMKSNITQGATEWDNTGRAQHPRVQPRHRRPAHRQEDHRAARRARQGRREVRDARAPVRAALDVHGARRASATPSTAPRR